MPKLRSPIPVDLTRAFRLNITIGSQNVFDVSRGLVSWYRDFDGDFVPDLTGRGNVMRRAGLPSQLSVPASLLNPGRQELRVDRKSFDFTFNATTDANVEYITTVNSTGAPEYVRDHIFFDELGRENDFTISFWFRPTVLTSNQVIIAKYAPFLSSLAEFLVYQDNLGRLYMDMYDSDGDRNVVRTTTGVPPNSWHHVCISYTASTRSCTFTVNGMPRASTSTIIGPSFDGLQGALVPTTFGAAWATGAFSQAASAADFRGYLYEVAIWNGRALSSLEASAVYAAVRFGVGDPRSGFISPPPRVLIQQLDSELNKNPSAGDILVRRSRSSVSLSERLKFENLGIRSESDQFNDSLTINFITQSVVFPAMLPAFSSYSDSLVPAATNMIGAESNVNVSLALRSHQQPAHMTRINPGLIVPFDDSIAIDPENDFYSTGTETSTLPGFTEPLWSKVKIEINLSSSDDSIITRNLFSDTGAVVPGLGTASKTGFNYYNFNTGMWDDIGLYNPVDNSPLPFRLDITESSPGVFSLEGIMSQFNGGATYGYTRFEKTSSGDVINITDVPTDTESLLNTFVGAIGATAIGLAPAFSCTPSNYASAPDHPKYFATSSNRLKLNDYIKTPFLLEKVAVEFDNVDVRQKIPASTGSLGYQYYHVHDNYIFFMYRQTNVPETVARSLSNRSIIMSGAMTFASPLTTFTLRDDAPQNSFSPAFLHEFDTSTVTIPNAIQNSYTGSIQLECQPGTAPIRTFNVNALPVYKSSGFDVSDPVGHPWPGGASARQLSDSDSSFLVGIDKWHLGTGSAESSRRNQVLFNSVNFDARALKTLGGQNIFSSGLTATEFVSLYSSWYEGQNSESGFNTPLSNNSPYLLMPGDDLIFGIEAGYSRLLSNPNDYSTVDRSGSLSMLPSSSMTIKAGNTRVTMYGSVLKNFQPVNNINPTRISSPALHYVIGDDSVLDQFELDFTESYFGSYLDQIVTGSLVTVSDGGKTLTVPSSSDLRKVISRVSLGQAGTTGSLQRFVNIADEKERVYDSCLPSYSIFLSGTTSFRVTSQLNTLGHELVVANPDSPSNLINRLSEVGGQFFKQFPYAESPIRLYGATARRRDLSGAATYFNGTARLPIAIDDTSKKPSLLSQYSLPKLKELIFTTRWTLPTTLVFGFPGTAVIKHRIGEMTTTSSAGIRKGTYRYGISNIEPEYTSVRWRSNHYGFLRDMLEQRRDTAFFDKQSLEPPVKCVFLSGSTVVAPELTHSQNISMFSTSSIPFFDEMGKTTFRSDDPDESLVEI
jgi:hypothetical protein